MNKKKAGIIQNISLLFLRMIFISLVLRYSGKLGKSLNRVNYSVEPFKRFRPIKEVPISRFTFPFAEKDENIFSIKGIGRSGNTMKAYIKYPS